MVFGRSGKTDKKSIRLPQPPTYICMVLAYYAAFARQAPAARLARPDSSVALRAGVPTGEPRYVTSTAVATSPIKVGQPALTSCGKFQPLVSEIRSGLLSKAWNAIELFSTAPRTCRHRDSLSTVSPRCMSPRLVLHTVFTAAFLSRKSLSTEECTADYIRYHVTWTGFHSSKLHSKRVPLPKRTSFERSRQELSKTMSLSTY